MRIEELAEKAKEKVERSYEKGQRSTRKWLVCSVDSYQDPNYRVELLVLEGSPSKGFIVADYGRGAVLGFSAWCRCVFRAYTQP